MSSTADSSSQQSRHDNSRAPEYGDTPRVIETATEARQGVTGHGVSTVLVVSTVAASVAFAVIYIYAFFIA